MLFCKNVKPELLVNTIDKNGIQKAIELVDWYRCTQPEEIQDDEYDTFLIDLGVYVPSIDFDFQEVDEKNLIIIKE